MQDGGIFLWDNENRTEVVGYLSDTEYTRIAVETDIRNNKYYAYINDVLVNPNGCQFISDKVLGNIRKQISDFQSIDFTPAEVRVYTVETNTSDAKHKGMWMDNILLAGRSVLNAGTSVDRNVYTMDLSGLTTDANGKNVVDYSSNKIPGTSDTGKSFYVTATNNISKYAVVYCVDGAEKSIQFKKITAQRIEDEKLSFTESDITADTAGQSYPRIDPGLNKDNVGQNVVLSAYFRAGSETIKKQDRLFTCISRVNNKKHELLWFSIDASRNLSFRNGADTVSIGKIPVDKYIKVELRVICNAADGRAMLKVYLDDTIALTTYLVPGKKDGEPWVGQSVGGQVLAANTPVIGEIHFTQDYAGAYKKYVEDDLHFKGVSVRHTSEYNTATPEGRFNPFGKNINGFVTTAGVTRYVENGIAKAEDFVLNGETYKVGPNGIIIGKLSDGVVQTPYAPYTDWDHNNTANYLINLPEAYSSGTHFYGSSVTMGLGRFATVKPTMYTKYGLASLYSSFLPHDGFTGDKNSYYDLGLGANKNNANLVLDFDIMAGQKLSNMDLVTLQTLTDPNGAVNSGNANRSDVVLIRVTADGWLTYGTRKIVKLSRNEFTRISLVLKTPDAVITNGEEYEVTDAQPVYEEDISKTKVTKYSYADFEALETKPVAQEKTPSYTGEEIRYSAATSIQDNIPEVGKRTVVTTATKTKIGTYTEITVVDDGTQMVVTAKEGKVSLGYIAYEETTVFTLNGSYSIYINGVQMVDETLIYSDVEEFMDDDSSVVHLIRMMQCQGNSALYVKDYYLYKDQTKPQKFYTMNGGVPALTDDQNAVPAQASDFKKGFVEEDTITRYYDELGLPMINTTFEVSGKEYMVDANGKLVCNGNNHIGVNSKGRCPGCGEKIDGVTALYGTSLILGSDVKVVFYLDIDTELLGDGAYLEVGLARDYASGTTEKLYLSGDDYTVEIGGETYFKVVYSVSAKDIYSDITVTPVAANGARGTQYVYSAADYAESVQLKQTDEVYTENLKALAKALLVYGKNAAAALVPDAEAAEEITEAVDWSGVTIPDGFKDLYQAIILDTVTLELKSNIKLKVYFTFNSGNFGMKTLANYTFKVDGEEVEYTDLGDGKYCIEKEIVAANLGEVYTFEIVDRLDVTGLCVKMSALYYAKIMAANANAPEGYANLMKAIKLYSDAANAYTPEIAEDVRPAV